ncbi:histidinol-phosphate transaminase [Conexibacter sp. DBS9H8]|uniref:histidinol-phosphate transaminase n=1 Tax=Conexibacter sp. DBS9H8 TaxID=2937801 RepID=UPI00200C20A8|nr:histidinol-phosphate transaminase [Conexibacter sp. DBS9H8]
MPIEFAEKLRRIPVYPAAAAYDLPDGVAMLASNEAPFAPAESVQAAAARALAGVHRYPDPAYQSLRAALAARYELDPAHISLGNGSCELLLAAGEALLEPDAEIVYAWPAFSVYPHLAAAAGARAIEVPLDRDCRHDLDAMAAEITVATRLVIVCNPNNPTSTALGLEEIDAFLAKVPRHVAVILDEAYVEFSLTVGDPLASLPLLARYPNLILLRTFSKVYGLAGLRVGYGLAATDEFRVATDQVRQPFFLNTAAQAAAVEALARQDEVERRVSATVAARETLLAGLGDLGCWVASSDANFLWVKLGPREVAPTADTATVEAEIVAGLRRRGVLVRAGAALGGPGFLRVTVGTAAENARFVAALSELLG